MIRLLSGDCRDVLPTLPAESVQCCVTSPPYFGLRDYGTALWDGGDANCQHEMQRGKAFESGTWRTGKDYSGSQKVLSRDCVCGAVRVDRQIGLEATPDEYLATMVGVFRQIRRVLRSDGTVWCNLGDSYAGATQYGAARSGAYVGDGGVAPPNVRNRNGLGATVGAKPKDLLLMPARLALALQADGWWIRSDVIWHKPNPMPESCRDRPTSAHEHVFLLTRSARYFYDADAVREAHEEPWRSGNGEYARDRPGESLETGRPRSFGWQKRDYNPAGRNLRNVWTIATHAYPDAHFATFPPELAERCIKAGTSERGCCAACGKPWGRVTEHGAAVPLTPSDAGRKATWTIGDAARDPDSRTDTPLPRHYRPVTSTGWSPGCQCGTTETRPCVVLDCFIGAGTTALVADRLQRDCIGIDLNTQYTRMAMDRCIADAPLLADLGPMPEHPEESAMADLFDMAAD